MYFFRIALALSLLLTLLHTPRTNTLSAWAYTTDLGGGGYQEARTSPALAPATLFALVALGAIIAIAIKNEKDHGHSSVHTHAH